MNTSNIHGNTDANASETLSLRAAAALVGVAPSTLSKHAERLLEAGARRVGSPPRWEIKRKHLERAGWLIGEHRERSHEQSETFAETPQASALVDWKQLFESERARAERAEAALETERRRIDGLTGALVMAVRQLEAQNNAAPEQPATIVEEQTQNPQPADVPRRRWWRWRQR